MTSANLSKADLRDADLYAITLANADLTDANLGNASLCDADLHQANLLRADLHDANLLRADLHNANLTDANLRDARLYHANLSGAKLIGASLLNADLVGANLHGANLIYVNLEGANLCGADLHKARLESAILISAQLTGAKFDHTNNVSAVVHPDTVRPFKRSPELECFGEYEPVANDPYAIHEADEVDEARARMWHAARTYGRACVELASDEPTKQVAELRIRLEIAFNAYERHRAANTRMAKTLRTIWLAATHGDSGTDTYPDELTARDDILTALAAVPNDVDPFSDEDQRS